MIRVVINGRNILCYAHVEMPFQVGGLNCFRVALGGQYLCVSRYSTGLLGRFGAYFYFIECLCSTIGGRVVKPFFVSRIGRFSFYLFCLFSSVYISGL